MSLQRLRWLTIAIAIGFLIMVQGLAMGFVMPTLWAAVWPRCVDRWI